MVTENQKFQSALFIKGIEHQKCYHLLTLKNVGNPYGPSIEKKKYYGSQWLPPFFKIYFVFNKETHTGLEHIEGE